MYSGERLIRHVHVFYGNVFILFRCKVVVFTRLSNFSVIKTIRKVRNLGVSSFSEFD